MMNRNGTARDKNKRRTDSMIPKKQTNNSKEKPRDDYNRDKLKKKNRGKNNNNNNNKITNYNKLISI
jgi:hypothetical protein